MLKKIKRIKLALKLLSFMAVPLLMVSCTVILAARNATAVSSDDIMISRCLEIPGDYLLMAQREVYTQGLDFIKLLALSAVLSENGIYDRALLKVAMAGMGRAMGEEEQELYDIFMKCYSEVKVAPIPEKTVTTYWEENGRDGELRKRTRTRHWSYTHYDDFGADRYYEGERRHYGNDLIARKGTPIVSMTDGEVTNMGWNELGGWRIGITDANGTYWYYAHMDGYAADIKQGDYIEVGTLVGYVGNTGYGPPGTSGQFVDHLHLQIGIELEESPEEYLWINPYPITVWMEPNRIVLEEEEE